MLQQRGGMQIGGGPVVFGMRRGKLLQRILKRLDEAVAAGRIAVREHLELVDQLLLARREAAATMLGRAESHSRAFNVFALKYPCGRSPSKAFKSGDASTFSEIACRTNGVSQGISSNHHEPVRPGSRDRSAARALRETVAVVTSLGGSP